MSGVVSAPAHHPLQTKLEAFVEAPHGGLEQQAGDWSVFVCVCLIEVYNSRREIGQISVMVRTALGFVPQIDGHLQGA